MYETYLDWLTEENVICLQRWVSILAGIITPLTYLYSGLNWTRTACRWVSAALEQRRVKAVARKRKERDDNARAIAPFIRAIVVAEVAAAKVEASHPAETRPPLPDLKAPLGPMLGQPEKAAPLQEFRLRCNQCGCAGTLSSLSNHTVHGLPGTVKCSGKQYVPIAAPLEQPK